MRYAGAILFILLSMLARAWAAIALLVNLLTGKVDEWMVYAWWQIAYLDERATQLWDGEG